MPGWHEQRLWQQWRNGCGGAVDCRARRSAQRVEDLGGAPSDRPGTGDGPVARITAGRSERVYPDGRIESAAINCGSQGIGSPDGTGTVSLFSEATPPSFPGLPSGSDGWGAQVENDLFDIIDGLLTPADTAGYRTPVADLAFSARVLRHLRAIRFLTHDQTCAGRPGISAPDHAVCPPGRRAARFGPR